MTPDVGLRSERGPILIALMLTTGLVAIDATTLATALATAIPTIVAELGGFSQFPWLFSVSLLAQAVTVIYAQLNREAQRRREGLPLRLLDEGVGQRL